MTLSFVHALAVRTSTLLLLGTLSQSGWSQPISYQSCGEQILLPKVPQRAISLDINTTEIMLKLGLASQMIATAGIRDRADILPEMRVAFDRLPMIAAAYPSLDTLVGKRPDFVFGGWQYGFSESSGVTPQRLGRFGIQSYALAESCIRIQSRENISLEDIFVDIRSIGRIFGREKAAEQWIRAQKEKIAGFPKPGSHRRPRLFLYDSGEASPFTAGRYAMPHAMMEAAGAQNIFEDLPSSWKAVSWEAVVARQPEFIIIVDYGDRSAAEKIRFLEEKFRKTPLNVMRRKHYIVLPYAAVVPGIRSIDATESLIQALRGRHLVSGT